MFTKANVEAYFNGEKQESLVFIIIGFTAILVALTLFFYVKHQWAKGAAWPLLLVGLIQVVVSYTVYTRSDGQRKDIVYKMDMNTQALQEEELPRMEKVMKAFVVYRYSEIGLLVAGIALFLFFRNQPDKQFWVGFGLSLTLQASIMLIADGFAERRGNMYFDGMKSFRTPAET